MSALLDLSGTKLGSDKKAKAEVQNDEAAGRGLPAPDDGSPSTSMNINDSRPQSPPVGPEIKTQDGIANSQREEIGAGFPPGAADPLLAYDEYGAELDKEARVWKVYVKEADKWDTELVEGWNRSLDVILVFAALFAAVATAFLIESSKRLQQDPADVSAEALVVISQTLLAIAHAQSMDPPTLPPVNNTTAFQPTQHAVVINTLWYLSLALSIATSLMAMFAKEWCHSFISNRNGHPWIQARRRQQKWMMIERWKMQEFLLVLPSLIHLSLLLFAIGLCIYVHDLHGTVAIPVITVTGIACAFYILSSATASVFEFFPYTTIISKVNRTVYMQEQYKYIYWLSKEALVLPFRLPTLICKICAMAVGNLVKNICYAWGCFCLGVGCLCCILPRGVGDILCHKWSPCGLLYRLLPWTVIPQYLFEKLPSISSIITDLKSIRRHYVQHNRVPGNNESHQDRITSLALSWIVKNCETPSSVAIVLQSIAGASEKLPRAPLQECQATLHILRRLVSNSLYKDPYTMKMSISLYSRALKFLGSHVEDTAELGVLIWDLHLEHENHIVNILTQAQFVPNDYNLQALRIGSTAASNSLRVLNEEGYDGNSALRSLATLLSQPLGNSSSSGLHPAALSSLAHAASLSCVCLPPSTQGNALIDLCLQFFEHQGAQEPAILSTVLVAIITQLQHTNFFGTQNEPLTRATRGIHSLLTVKSSDIGVQKGFIWVGTQHLIQQSNTYGLTDLVLRRLKSIERAYNPFSNFWRTATSDEGSHVPRRKAVTLCLQAIDLTYQQIFVSVRVLDCHAYAFILEGMCAALKQNWDNRQDLFNLCHKLITTFGFPKSSPDLLNLLYDRGIIPSLKHCASLTTLSTPMQRLARIQIWLFCTILYHAPNRFPRLESQLKKLNESFQLSLPQSITVRQMKWRLEELILDELEGTYSYRVAECILETRDASQYSDLRNRIAEALKDVPQELRGLQSFISLNSTPGIVTTQPSPHVSMTVHPGLKG